MDDATTGNSLPVVVAEFQSLELLQEPIKTTSRIKYTCLSVSGTYLAVGSTSGGIYIFHRESTKYLTLIPSQEGPIVFVKFSPQERYIAFASSRGIVGIHEFTAEKRSASHRLISSTSDLLDVTITAISWDSEENCVFIGTDLGRVSLLNVPTSLTRDLLTASHETVLKLDSSIVQIDCLHEKLLVSTLTRCYLSDTVQRSFCVIGSKSRSGRYGCCFLRLTNDETPPIYTARPSSRLWEVDYEGSVVNTHLFKQLLAQPPATFVSSLQKTICLPEEKSYSAQSLAFKQLLQLGCRYLFSWQTDAIYVFDPIAVKAVLWCDKIIDIADVQSVKNDLYVLHSDGKLSRLCVQSLHKCIITLCQQHCWKIAAKLCLHYEMQLIPASVRHLVTIDLISQIKLNLQEQEQCDVSERLQIMLSRLEGSDPPTLPSPTPSNRSSSCSDSALRLDSGIYVVNASANEASTSNSQRASPWMSPEHRCAEQGKAANYSSLSSIAKKLQRFSPSTFMSGDKIHKPVPNTSVISNDSTSLTPIYDISERTKLEPCTSNTESSGHSSIARDGSAFVRQNLVLARTAIQDFQNSSLLRSNSADTLQSINKRAPDDRNNNQSSKCDEQMMIQGFENPNLSRNFSECFAVTVPVQTLHDLSVSLTMHNYKSIQSESTREPIDSSDVFFSSHSQHSASRPHLERQDGINRRGSVSSMSSSELPGKVFSSDPIVYSSIVTRKAKQKKKSSSDKSESQRQSSSRSPSLSSQDSGKGFSVSPASGSPHTSQSMSNQSEPIAFPANSNVETHSEENGADTITDFLKMSERMLCKLTEEVLIFSPVESRKMLVDWVNACHDSLASAVYKEQQVLPFAAEQIRKSDLPMLLQLLDCRDESYVSDTLTENDSSVNTDVGDNAILSASEHSVNRTKLLHENRTVADAHSDSNVLAMLFALKYLVKKSGIQCTFLRSSINEKYRTVVKDLLTLCYEFQVYGDTKCLLQKTFLASDNPTAEYCENVCALEDELVQDVCASVFLLFYQFCMDNTRIANVFHLSIQHNYLSFCTFLDNVNDCYEQIPISLEAVSDQITAWIFFHRLLEGGSTELTPSIIQTLSSSHWSFLSICRKTGQYPAVYKQYLDLCHEMTDNFLRDSVFKSVCRDSRLHDYFLDTMLSSFTVAATCTCGMPLPTADISLSWHNINLLLDILDMTVHCSYWLERCWMTGFWPGYLTIAKKLGKCKEVMKILLQLGNLLLLNAKIRYGYIPTTDENWRDLFSLKSQQLQSKPFNSTEILFNSERTELVNAKGVYCLNCKELILISEEILCCENSWHSERLSNRRSKSLHQSVSLTGKSVNPCPSDACFQGRQLCFSWNHLVTLCVKEIGVVRTLTVLKDIDMPSRILGSDFFHLCLQEVAVHQQQGPLVCKLLEELSEQLWVIPSNSSFGSLLLMQTSEVSCHTAGGIGVKTNISQPCHVCFLSLSHGRSSSIFFSCGHGFHRSCLPDGFYCQVCIEH